MLISYRKRLKQLYKDYFKLTHLIKRGWTKSEIKRLLGEPDLKLPHPFWLGGKKVNLFLKERFLKTEKNKR